MAMRYSQYTFFPLEPPDALIRLLAVEANRNDQVTILCDGPHLVVSRLDGEDPERTRELVDHWMTAVMDALLDDGWLHEDDIVQPRQTHDDHPIRYGGLAPRPSLEGGLTPPALEGGVAPPALEGGLAPPALIAGMAPPALEGGLTPPAQAIPAITLLDRVQLSPLCYPSQLRVHGNMSWDGKSAWVALLICEMRCGDFRIHHLDGHITLFHLIKSAVDHLDLVLHRLRSSLEKALAKGDWHRFALAGALNTTYAVDDYCWIDIFVRMPIHDKLFEFVNDALQLPVRRQHVVTKKAVTKLPW